MSVVSKTSRSVGRPPDVQLKDRRRSEILEAATSIFSKRGYAPTDVQDIAALAGVGKGTVYRYFPGKEELFLSTVDHGMRKLKEAVDLAANRQDLPLNRLVAGVLAYLTFFDEHPEVVELFVQERAYFRDRQKPTYFVHHEANLGPWRALFQDLLETGVVRSNLSAERITDFISDLLYGMMFTNYFGGRKSTPAAQCHDALDIIYGGILTKSEEATSV